MEILFKVLFFLAFGLMAMRMIRSGGCCGGSTQRPHNKSMNRGGSCCSGHSKKDSDLE